MPRKTFERAKETGFSTIDETGKNTPTGRIPVICERIRFYREKCGIEQNALASAIGISGNAICNWENGRSRPDINLIPAICSILGVTLYQLYDMEEPGESISEEEASLLEMYRSLSANNRYVLRNLAGSLIDTQMKDECPEIDELIFIEKGLAAGIGDPTELERDGSPIYLYSTQYTKKADYVFPVSGNSMEPEYHNGDRVLVQTVHELNYGDVGAFIIGNELYIKVLEKEGLRSLNTDYAFMDFSNAEQTVYIIGKVIGKISPEDEATEDDVEMFLEVKKRMGE